MEIGIPADKRIKIKEREKIGKYLDLTRELKKTWNFGVIVIPIIVGVLETVSKGSKKTGGTINQSKNRDHFKYSIVKISLNTEKCPGDLEGLAVTQIHVKDHQLMLARKSRKEYSNNNDNNKQMQQISAKRVQD